MSERLWQCCAIRTANNPNRHPGEQRVYRCRNKAGRAIRVHQASDHPRVADGWFEVDLCDPCFYRSAGEAVVNLKGRKPWRWL